MNQKSFMNKQEIISSLLDKYNSFIKYMNELSPEDYLFGYQQKWTAGQQLKHIVLCVEVLVQVFNMPKSIIEQKFGLTAKSGCSYEELTNKYVEKFKEGGKAPDRFVPGFIPISQGELLCNELATLVSEVCSKIENFTEQELDTLRIPHPLLGNLSMREMLYNTIYHVEHHHVKTMQNLKNKRRGNNYNKGFSWVL